MKYGKKRLFLPLLVTCILALFFYISSHTVNAQTQGFDVTISPVFFDLSSNPGDTLTEKIRVRNNTTAPIPIKIEIKRLTGDVNGDLTLSPTAPDDSLSWIKLSANTFVAKPLEWSDVSFTVDIPKTAAYGYYFAISFKQDDASPLAKTGAKITGAAAVPILLNVRKEGAKAEAKILDFSVGQGIYEYLPVDFNITLQNTGNVHLRPHGNIFINGTGSRNIGILDVNNQASSIIPNTKKVFKVSWEDGFLVKEPIIENGVEKVDKNGNPIEKITINWNKLTSFRVGRYTANLILVYDNGKRDVSLEKSVSFWVLPYKAIGIIIISLIIIFLIVRFLLKRYIRSQIRKALPRS